MRLEQTRIALAQGLSSTVAEAVRVLTAGYALEVTPKQVEHGALARSCVPTPLRNYAIRHEMRLGKPGWASAESRKGRAAR
jgi:hypothetical protein